MFPSLVLLVFSSSSECFSFSHRRELLPASLSSLDSDLPHVNRYLSFLDCRLLPCSILLLVCCLQLASVEKRTCRGPTGKMGRDSLSGSIVIGRGVTVSNWMRVGFSQLLVRCSLQWGWWDTGRGCPEQLWMPLPGSVPGQAGQGFQ